MVQRSFPVARVASADPADVAFVVDDGMAAVGALVNGSSRLALYWMHRAQRILTRGRVTLRWSSGRPRFSRTSPTVSEQSECEFT